MGELGKLPVPQTGALAELPVPQYSGPTPQDMGEAASPMQRGLRSGALSLAGHLNDLAGQTGQTMGLTEFANNRFKDAENYANEADKADGHIKDFGQVHDFATLTHFVAGLVGKSLPPMVPAIAGGIGLRRPIAGTFAGFLPGAAGEHVRTLRADPQVMANSTPGDILGNSLGAGAVVSGLNATLGAPGQFVNRALGMAAKDTLASATGKAALGNAAAAPLSNIAGQKFHQELNPDKKLDTSHLAEETIIGGGMGAVFGAGGHAIGSIPRMAQSAGELRQRFKKEPAPIEPDVEADVAPPGATAEQIFERMKTGEAQAREYAKTRWNEFKDMGIWKNIDEFTSDPEIIKASAESAKKKWQDSNVKPVVEGAMKYGKDLAERIKAKAKESGTKHSLMENKRDDKFLAIHDVVMEHLNPELTPHLKPNQLLAISDMIKRVVENPDYFAETGVPHRVEDLFAPGKFKTALEKVAEKTGSDYRQIKEAFTNRDTTDATRADEIKKVLYEYMQEGYLADPARRKVIMDEVAPRLLKRMSRPDATEAEMQQWHTDMLEAFGENTAAATAALDKIRDKKQITTDAAFKGKEQNFDEVQEGVMDPRSDEPAEHTPAQDTRLDRTFNDTKKGYDEALALANELESEFGRKNAKVYIDADHETGLLRLRLENAEQKGLDDTSWARVREPKKFNRSGLENGILTVQKYRLDENGKPKLKPNGEPFVDENKINLQRLTSEMMAREHSSERAQGGEAYVRDMFSRGMTELMNSPMFKDVKDLRNADGSWNIPDNTPIASHFGKKYTYGDIKKVSMTRMELKDVTKEDIQREMDYIRNSESYKKNPLSAKALYLAGAERAVERAYEKAMEHTLFDNRDIDPKAEDSGRTKEATGERTYDEDTGMALGQDDPKSIKLGKTAGTTKFSTMNIGKGPVDPEVQAKVREYVEKVLGPDAKVIFEKMNEAGSFAKLNGVETLKISVDALDPSSVGYHEALHALMSRLIKADQKAANTLLRAANAPAIVSRLRQLLKDHPEALKQLNDPEERLAYMYQFAAAGEKGLINLGPETKTFFDKVKTFFRKLAAVWADDLNTADAVERASDILTAFHNGDLANKSTVAQVIRDKFPRSALEATEEMMPWASKLMNKFIWTSTGAVRDFNNPHMTKIMDMFHTATGSVDNDVGFIQAKTAAYNRFINRVSEAFKTMPTEERQKIVWDDLHSGEAATTPEGKMIRTILDEAHDYLVKSNVKLVIKDAKGKFTMEDLVKRENYFPRVYDQDVMRSANGKKEFLELLAKYKVPEKDAKEAYDNITKYMESGKPGEEDSAIGLTYYTPALGKRTLGFIPDAELAPFLNKDLFGTLSQYLQRATRRGEYAKRFGNIGETIKEAREDAAKAGATEQQLAIFDDSVKAMEGTLGADMDPKLKQIYSGLMTYQNIRLLPLQIFSSLIDPLGIAVRGGELKEAFTTFGKGIRDLAKFKDDDAMQLARTIGAIDAANAHGLMSEMAGSEYMPKLQRTINDKFFRYNGMEKWNNRMRAQASIAAENFIMRHAEKPNKHSERYLSELGLTKDDVQIVNNRLVLDDKIMGAMNKWVDEAILRPNAALRPIYMSDPNWMLISHLKQYTYLFQKVIVSRVYHEAAHGNFTPAMTLAGYVPAMMAADMLKVGLTPGSGDDNARAGWDAMDWLGHGMQRAGLFGPSQLGLDAGQDFKRGGIGLESAAGPTVQQLINFAQGATQGHLGLQIKKAVPGYSLIKPAGG